MFYLFFLFFLNSYGCCKNAVKASSAGACGAEERLFTFLETSKFWCVMMEGWLRCWRQQQGLRVRTQKERCLEEVAGRSLPAACDYSFCRDFFRLACCSGGSRGVTVCFCSQVAAPMHLCFRETPGAGL